MKLLIVVAISLMFAVGAFADDNGMNTNTGAEGAATTQTHHHKKHEKKMKKAHHKKQQNENGGENTQGAPAGNQ